MLSLSWLVLIAKDELASELSVLLDELTSAGSIDDSELLDARRSILYEAETIRKETQMINFPLRKNIFFVRSGFYHNFSVIENEFLCVGCCERLQIYKQSQTNSLAARVLKWTQNDKTNDRWWCSITEILFNFFASKPSGLNFNVWFYINDC